MIANTSQLSIASLIASLILDRVFQSLNEVKRLSCYPMMSDSAVYAKPHAFCQLSSVHAAQVRCSLTPPHMITYGLIFHFLYLVFVIYLTHLNLFLCPDKLICMDCVPELCSCEPNEKSLR